MCRMQVSYQPDPNASGLQCAHCDVSFEDSITHQKQFELVNGNRGKKKSSFLANYLSLPKRFDRDLSHEALELHR